MDCRGYSKLLAGMNIFLAVSCYQVRYHIQPRTAITAVMYMFQFVMLPPTNKHTPHTTAVWLAATQNKHTVQATVDAR